MRGSWYKLGDRVLCVDCARHIAGTMVQGKGPAPTACSFCGGQKIPRPPSRYYHRSMEESRRQRGS